MKRFIGSYSFIWVHRGVEVGGHSTPERSAGQEGAPGTVFGLGRVWGVVIDFF